MRILSVLIVGALSLTVTSCGQKEETAAPVEKKQVKLLTSNSTQKAPIPLSEMSSLGPKEVFFGDLHVHSKNSYDAYIFNVRTTPSDVYRFAKGAAVRHPNGYDIKIDRPLDFQAVTDHGVYMGILPAMADPSHHLSQLQISKDLFTLDRQKAVATFQDIRSAVRTGIPKEEIYDLETIKSVWHKTVEAANRHYEPGKFTTFAGYEYTSVTPIERENIYGGANMHRNVIFEGIAADMIFTVLNSKNPEDLWDWMDEQRAEGVESMAIPHNSNVSDGLMFGELTYEGHPMTAEYATQRMRNEPIVELSQAKGTSETHPSLSPNDEFADFGIFEALLGGFTISKTSGGYVREAYGHGLKIEEVIGVNPYKFGLIGSSDSHVAGGSYNEDSHWSKAGIVDGLPQFRGSVPPKGKTDWEGVEVRPDAKNWYSKWDASGLMAVWAEENTRESIFAAMRRKETYTTSGTRIKLRFFAGDYAPEMHQSEDVIDQAYGNGVSMGGDLNRGASAPSFFVWAQQDPYGAPLDRAQIVKVWLDKGEPQERIYDMICADGRVPSAGTHKCDATKARVNLENCDYSQDLGAAELKALWQDPDFVSDQKAVYYVRILENPTCRWSTWDAIKAGVPPNPSMPSVIQERAWSSPIWYNP